MKTINLNFLRNNSTSWKLFKNHNEGIVFELLLSSGEEKAMLVSANEKICKDILKKLEKTNDIAFSNDGISRIIISDSDKEK